MSNGHNHGTIPGVIQSHHGPVRALAAAATITALSGARLWNLPAAWDKKRVPGPDDVVLIPAGSQMTITDEAAVCYDIGVYGGALTFASDANTRLRVRTIQSHGGRVDIGTAAAPIQPDKRCSLLFRDFPLSQDPEWMAGGIQAIDGTFTVYGTYATPWAAVHADLKAGQTSIPLTAPVTGWKAGDRLFVPDTREYKHIIKPNEATAPGVYHPDNDLWREQVAVVKEVSADGFTVTLTEPLKADHLLFVNALTGERYPFRIAHMSANVELRSENPGGARAHIMLMGRVVADVNNCRLVDMGRTRLGADVKANGGGDAAAASDNVKGRYPLHWHHAANGLALGGYTGRVRGLRVENFKKWAIAVHHTNKVVVESCVVLYGQGTGITTSEDGTERECEVRNNYVARVGGHGLEKIQSERPDEAGEGGFGIWGIAPLRANLIDGNYVHSCTLAGTHYYAHTSMLAAANQATGGVPRFPKRADADPHNRDDYETLQNPDAWFAFGIFPEPYRNNVCCCCMIGHAVLGAPDDVILPGNQGYYNHEYEWLHGYDAHLKDCRFIGDPAATLLNDRERKVCIGSVYQTYRVTLDNVECIGKRRGIWVTAPFTALGGGRDFWLSLKGGRIAALEACLMPTLDMHYISAGHTGEAAAGRTWIDGTQFHYLRPSAAAIAPDHMIGSDQIWREHWLLCFIRNTNLAERRGDSWVDPETGAVLFPATPGQDWLQVWYAQQIGDFPCPVTTTDAEGPPPLVPPAKNHWWGTGESRFRVRGAPEDGLTVRQVAEKYCPETKPSDLSRPHPCQWVPMGQVAPVSAVIHPHVGWPDPRFRPRITEAKNAVTAPPFAGPHQYSTQLWQHVQEAGVILNGWAYDAGNPHIHVEVFGWDTGDGTERQVMTPSGKPWSFIAKRFPLEPQHWDYRHQGRLYHWFSEPVPPSLLDGEQHRIQLRDAEGNVLWHHPEASIYPLVEQPAPSPLLEELMATVPEVQAARDELVAAITRLGKASDDVPTVMSQYVVADDKFIAACQHMIESGEELPADVQTLLGSMLASFQAGATSIGAAATRFEEIVAYFRAQTERKNLLAAQAAEAHGKQHHTIHPGQNEPAPAGAQSGGA